MDKDVDQAPAKCEPLKLDDFQRSVMPMGVVGLLLFGIAWMSYIGWSAYEQYKLQEHAATHTAEVFESAAPYVMPSGETIRSFRARYRDARGKEVTFEIPKGIERSSGVQFSVLEDNGNHVLPERVQSNLWISAIMALAGLLPFFVAPRALATARQEQARIARLTKLNQRTDVIAIRVSEHRVRKAKSYRQVFRVHATFRHADGKLYEMVSQDFNYDPSEALAPANVQVLIDHDAPLQSLIAEDTLPERRKGFS
jgi:hypothetical protein